MTLPFSVMTSHDLQNPVPAAPCAFSRKPSVALCPGLLAVLCCVDIVAMTLVGFLRYDQYTANGFDLGIFQQAVWLIAHRLPAFVTIRGLHILGDHWTPILYLLAPLAKLFSGPRFLIVFQAVVLPLGAIPLYRLAQRRTGSGWLALALAASYMVHPSLWGMGVFDFHPSSLAVTPLLAAVDALDASSPGWFAGWCVASLVCKEDIALAVIMLGVLAWFWKRWKLGPVIALLSLVWLILGLHAMAALSHATSSSYWSLYGSTLGTLNRGPAVFVAAVARKLATPLCYLYLVILLAPVGFVCFAAPDLLVVALPSLMSNLLSERFIMQEVGFQYDVVPLALVYAAAAVGLGRIVRRAIASGEPTRNVRGFAAGLLIVSALMGIACYDPSIVRRYFYAPTAAETARQCDELLKMIPANASVTAPDRVVPHLAGRCKIYLFPNPVQEACWGSSQQALDQEMQARFVPYPPALFERKLSESGIDYVVLSENDRTTWPLRTQQYRDLFANSLACPDYGVIARGGEMVLLRKGAPHIAGLQQLGAPVSDESSPAQVRELVLRQWRE